jgi:hypothetical protein
MKLFGYEFNRQAPKAYIERPADDTIGKFTFTYEPTIIVPATAENYKNAINAARWSYNQQRQTLYDMYQNAIDFDSHLKGLIEKRILASTGKKIEYRLPNGDASERAEALMKSPRWDEFLHAVLYYRIFWGMGLFVIGKRKWNEQQLFDFGAIPCKHIDPFQQVVRKYAFGASDGDESYAKDPNAIFVGHKEDLGLLLQLALNALYKRALMNNWAKYAEKAGNNFEVIKYQGAQPDQSERDRVLLKLANRGANSATDLPMGVSHEVTNMSSSSQNQLFENQFKALNDEMSKLVLGQTMTTEDGSSQSQAEVHERTQETIFDSDSKNLIDTLNYEFAEIGVKMFDLEPGGEFVYAENMTMDTEKMIELDVKLSQIGYIFTQEELKERYGL